MPAFVYSMKDKRRNVRSYHHLKPFKVKNDLKVSTSYMCIFCETFALECKSSRDRPEVAFCDYLIYSILSFRLFTRERQLKKLFYQLMTRENSGEVVFDESRLRSHGKTVMETLGTAVVCLDDSSQLTKLLVETGERHAHYGVRPEMIPVSTTF